jgi:hypothetical protein
MLPFQCWPSRVPLDPHPIPLFDGICQDASYSLIHSCNYSYWAPVMSQGVAEENKEEKVGLPPHEHTVQSGRGTWK